MGTRGVWNLRVLGKWYRFIGSKRRVSSLDEERTFRSIKALQSPSRKLEGWEQVPFPCALHILVDYIYTVDLDAGYFTVALWEGRDGRSSLEPLILQIGLDKIHSAADLTVDSLRRDGSEPALPSPKVPGELGSSSAAYGFLDIKISPPSPLNELQHRFFVDFAYQWRHYIDNPWVWQYPSPLFKMLCIALLRLAAWDFEATSDLPDELPVGVESIPHWQYPETDVFWFHEFLVVLCEALDTPPATEAAVSRGQHLLSTSDQRNGASLMILLSLHHVVFVKQTGAKLSCSAAIPLVVNSSAMQCSPGFRALAHVITSFCWKRYHAAREHWGVHLPPEVLGMVLAAARPRDLVSFCQASFAVERWYYSSVPQLGDLQVRSFEKSIACCSDRGGIEVDGVYCPSCYAWRHARCAGLDASPPDHRYMCSECREGKISLALDPGGVTKASRRKDRGAGCRVNSAGVLKFLQLRCSRPFRLRPESFMVRYSSWSPRSLEIDYAIRFNGAFSGLAYGLDDEPSRP